MQLWKDSVTKELHFLVYSLLCDVHELLVGPLPTGAKRDGVPYPSGAHITDLKAVRGLLSRQA